MTDAEVAKIAVPKEIAALIHASMGKDFTRIETLEAERDVE